MYAVEMPHYSLKKLNAGIWSRVRRDVLTLDNWRCQVCGCYANQVDHIKPLHQGGPKYDHGNLQTICKDCHLKKSLAENPGLAEKRAWRQFLLESE